MPPEPEFLPAVPGDDELVGVVVDAPQQRPVYVLRVIAVVVRHPVPRATVRHAGYVPAGLVVAWRRYRARRTLAHDIAHRAHLSGDNATALLMLQQAELERNGRADRRDAFIETVIALAKASPVFLGLWAGAMVLAGLALAFDHHNPRWFLWPWETLFGAVGALVTAAQVLMWVLSIGIPLGIGLRLWWLGAHPGEHAPGWVQTSAEDDADYEVTELMLTNALANMRFPQVRDYLKLGAPLQFIVPCRQEGRGTYAEIRLPGLAAEKVVRRRADFAASVHRAAKEVWPTVGTEAAVLRVWIADRGALEEGAGEYPLLKEGFTDVFKGLPFGRTLKGDPTKIPVIGRNSIVGGAPEQGKSNSARVTACGYALDLIAELRIYVPDANFDFDAFAPRCSRYLVGAEDEVIERMLEEQELLKEELQQRGQLLRDYEVQEVTREIAHAGVGLHPVLILVEEAHVPITHKKFGKDFGQLLGDNVKLCRKRGAHIEVSTQAPVRGSMPRDVTTNCTVGIAHALSDVYANDAILGPGAHSGGHRATELIPGTDRGIALCKGFSSEARSEMVQAYRITTAQVPAIVARAMAELARQGRPVPGTERGPLAIVSRDLLADLMTVLRSPDRILVRDAVGLLRELAPSWGRYRTMTATSLRGDLLELGVRTVNTSGTHFLDPADLRAAVARREACE